MMAKLTVETLAGLRNRLKIARKDAATTQDAYDASKGKASKVRTPLLNARDKAKMAVVDLVDKVEKLKAKGARATEREEVKAVNSATLEFAPIATSKDFAALKWVRGVPHENTETGETYVPWWTCAPLNWWEIDVYHGKDAEPTRAVLLCFSQEFGQAILRTDDVREAFATAQTMWEVVQKSILSFATDLGAGYLLHYAKDMADNGSAPPPKATAKPKPKSKATPKPKATPTATETIKSKAIPKPKRRRAAVRSSGS